MLNKDIQEKYQKELGVKNEVIFYPKSFVSKMKIDVS